MASFKTTVAIEALKECQTLSGSWPADLNYIPPVMAWSFTRELITLSSPIIKEDARTLTIENL